MSIIDMRKSNYIPPGVAVHICNVIRMSQSHNNASISVFLDAMPIVQAMIKVLRRAYPNILAQTDWLYTHTLEEARVIAQEQVDKPHAQQS
jgi:hypothetical protein